MKTVRVKIDPSAPLATAPGRIDPARVDATTEEEIAKQKAADEAEAMLNAARSARRVKISGNTVKPPNR